MDLKVLKKFDVFLRWICDRAKEILPSPRTEEPAGIAAEDLERACPACGGAGYVKKPECAVLWYEDVEMVSEEAPAPSYLASEGDTCPICMGLGTVPTESGRILIEFLQKYL